MHRKWILPSDLNELILKKTHKICTYEYSEWRTIRNIGLPSP